MSQPLAVDLPAVPPADWRLQIPAPRRRRLQLWLWSIAAMTCLVLVVGGITRLTHSGLSIVDWDPLMGVVPPLSEARWMEMFDRYRQFPEYNRLRQGMTLEEFKIIFFWEYLHRLLARAIGIVFLVPFVGFWLSGSMTSPIAWRALALFFLGAMQGVIGWLMVQSGLVDRPSVSHYRLAAHLSLAFVIFGAAVWLALDLTPAAGRPRVAAHTRKRMSRALTMLGVLLAIQIVWGALVAGLKAGFVYNTFPLTAGRLVPPDLLTLSPAALNFVQNLVSVQWTHRMLGTVLLIAAGIAFLAVRRSGPDPASRYFNAALAGLIAFQYLLGVLALLYSVPIALGVAHQATALITAGVWVAWLHHVRRLTHDM